MTFPISSRQITPMQTRIQFAKLCRQNFSADELLVKIFEQKQKECEAEQLQVKQILFERLQALNISQNDLLQNTQQIDILAAARMQIEQLEQRVSNFKAMSNDLLENLQLAQLHLIKERDYQLEIKQDLQKFQQVLKQSNSLMCENFANELTHYMANPHKPLEIKKDDKFSTS